MSRIEQLIFQQAKSSPDAIAIRNGTTKWSYADLVLKASSLSTLLNEKFKVPPNAVVGIFMERCGALIASILGVLKSKCAYVPFDSKWPDARIASIVNDTRLKLVICSPSLADRFATYKDCAVILFDDSSPPKLNPTRPITPQAEAFVDKDINEMCSKLNAELCYILYTSGTTGVPKGVCIAHQGVVNQIQQVSQHVTPPQFTRVTLFSSSACFDASLDEIFLPLISGGCIVIADSLLSLCDADAAALYGDVTFVNGTPSAVQMLLETGRLPASVSAVELGGEAMSGALARQLFARGIERLANVYGPTECTNECVVATMLQAPPGDRVPIGRALGGMSAHVVDAQRTVLHGADAVGELWIGGAGVALGYLRRAEQTAAKFVVDTNVRADGARLYRTGDLVRVLADGQLEFVGRVDNQVKVRGFRVELEEVESALTACDDIAAACASLQDSHLVAHLLLSSSVDEARRQSFDTQALKASLARTVPAYMVPSGFAIIDELPLAVTGKVDRAKLCRVELGSGQADSEAQPKNSHEKAMLRIWRDVLRLPTLHVLDDFYEVGGNSLSAVRIVARAEKIGFSHINVKVLRQEANVRAVCQKLIEIGRSTGAQSPSSHSFDSHSFDSPPAYASPAVSSDDQPTALSLAAEDSARRRLARFAKVADCVRDAPNGALSDVYELTPMQSGMLFYTLRNPADGVYADQWLCDLNGDLDIKAFQGSWQRVVRRHDSLRASFAWTGLDEPLQLIWRDVPLAWKYNDLSQLSAPRRRSLLDSYLRADRERGFALDHAPLMRFALFRVAAKRHVFVWTSHHVLMDGWSLPLILDDVFHGTSHRRAPKFAPFVERTLQPRRPASLRFWREQLTDLPDRHELPFAHARQPVDPRAPFASLAHRFSADTAQNVAQFARSLRVTPSTVYQSVWLLLLSVYLDTDDVLAGMTVAGRPTSLRNVESTVGNFLNTLPLRATINTNQTISQFITALQTKLLDIDEHDDVPLVELQRLAGVAGDESMFDTLIVFEDVCSCDYGAAFGARVRKVRWLETTNFLLTLAFAVDRECVLNVSFDPKRLDRDKCAIVVKQYARMLKYVVSHGDANASRVSRVIAERPLLMNWHAPTLDTPATTLYGLLAQQAAATPQAPAVYNATVPNTPPIVWSYEQLLVRTRHVAWALAERGVAPQSFVGLLVSRSSNLLAALFGILRRGAAYVPLDSQWPTERLSYVANDADVAVMLTDHATWEKCGELLLNNDTDDDDNSEKKKKCQFKPLFVDDLFSDDGNLKQSESYVDVNLQPDWLAYVLYTSGTTGRPKGVCVQHDSVVNEVHFMGTQIVSNNDNDNNDGETKNNLNVDDLQLTLFATSVCFDASVDELFVPLAFGGAIVVVNNILALCDVDMNAADQQAKRDNLLRSITLLNGTPSAIQMLVETQHVPLSVKLVLLGGEALSRRTAEALFALLEHNNVRVYNVYGPTEATDLCLIEQVKRGDKGAPLLGHPIANMKAHVVSARTLTPLPVGVPGELIIQGIGVSKGYWCRDDLTATRFLSNFREVGGVKVKEIEDADEKRVAARRCRAYRTGDLVRRRDDGRLEYLGRIDRQIKLRGYRIELGEVESQICMCDNVSQCAVVVAHVGSANGSVSRAGNASASLVAYIVGTASVADVSAHCTRTMPRYMVPSIIMPIAALPLNRNDKIDYKALPPPVLTPTSSSNTGDSSSKQQQQQQQQSSFVHQLQPREQLIADVFAEVLKQSRAAFTADTDFFQIGGDSLSAMRAVARISRALEAPVSLGVLFANSTVGALAKATWVDSDDEASDDDQRSVAPAMVPVVIVPRLSNNDNADDDNLFTCSFAQERMWFLNKLFPESAEYHMPASYVIRGSFSVDKLRAALTQLVARHEVLRTTYVMKDAELKQRLNAPSPVDVPLDDYSGPAITAPSLDDILGDRACTEASAPFDLSNGPVLRARVIRLEPQLHVFLLTIHHIAGDGVSFDIIEQELKVLYEAKTNNKQEALEKIQYQYIDYANWQRQAIAPVLNKQLSYWRAKLGGDLSPIELPYDRSHPATASFRAASIPVHIDFKLAEKLRTLARASGTTMFMTLLAAWQYLLHVYSRQDCVTVGAPSAGRNRVEFDDTVGLFVNTLVLRTLFNTESTSTFAKLLGTVRHCVLGAFDHQDVPFEQLVKELQPERDERRNPLFQVFFDVSDAETVSAGDGDSADVRNLGDARGDGALRHLPSSATHSGTLPSPLRALRDTLAHAPESPQAIGDTAVGAGAGGVDDEDSSSFGLTSFFTPSVGSDGTSTNTMSSTTNNNANNNSNNNNNNNQSSTERYWRLGDAVVCASEPAISGTQFELALTLSGVRGDGTLHGELEYAKELFDRETAARIVEHLLVLLRLVSEPNGADKPLAELSLLSQTEQTLEVEQWNCTTASFPHGESLASLLAKQYERTPDAVALRDQRTQVTYAQMMVLTARVAKTLLKHELLRANTSENRFVGVLMQRNVAIVAALYGVLRANCAYVPLDTAWPADRLAYVIQDAEINVLLTDKQTWQEHSSSFDDNKQCQPVFVDELLSELFEENNNGDSLKLKDDNDLINVDDDNDDDDKEDKVESSSEKKLVDATSVDVLVKPTSLAYVLYTSGTTGKPKGVCVEHRSVVNEVWHMGTSVLSRADIARSLFATSICFDASVDELFVPLTFGGSIVVARNILQLCEPAQEQLFGDITLLNGTPSAIQMLLDTKRVPSTTRVVLLGGEALSRRTSDLIFRALKADHVRVYNVYGPTEATDLCLVERVRAGGEGAPLLGNPIANTKAHVVLPNSLTKLPIGVAGELIIQGVGVARGYWRRDELTKQRFLEAPVFGVDERAYRTGDLVCRSRDGKLEYLGRIDRQIKLRGYRIELDEIEAQLCDFDGVELAAVVVRSIAGSTPTLIAYFVGATVDESDLRQHCQETMPKYMVPSAFMKLERLPLNANDKVDYKALPLPDSRTLNNTQNNEEDGIEYEKMNDDEKIIADVWASVLKCEPNELRGGSEFFERGGDSLSAMRAMALLSERIGRDLPLSSLFQHASVSALAEFIGDAVALRSASTVARVPIVRVSDTANRYRLSFAQERFWFLDRLFPGGSEYNMPTRYDLRGVLKRDALRCAFEELVRRHTALRMRFVHEHGSVHGELLPVLNEHVSPSVAHDDDREAWLRGAWREVELNEEAVGGDSSGDEASDALASRLVALEQLAKSDASAPFLLASGPPLRATLVRVRSDWHVLLLTLHHIAGDGASFVVIERELKQLYEAARSADSAMLDTRVARRAERRRVARAALPPVQHRYVDYAHWQRAALAPLLTDQLAYWQATLGDDLSPIELPYDGRHPPKASFAAAAIDIVIDTPLANQLRQLSTKHGTTMFMTLLASWHYLLHIYSRQENISVGSPIAGRSRAEFVDTVGVFVNTLVLRANFEEKNNATRTFESFLAATKQTVLGAFDHQDVPFEQLVKELQPERDERRNPLFQVMFDVTNVDTTIIERGNDASAAATDVDAGETWKLGDSVTVTTLEPPTDSTQFELALSVSGRNDGSLCGELEYAVELFERDTAVRIVEHWLKLLQLVVDAPSTPLRTLCLLSDREKRMRQAGWQLLPDQKQQLTMSESTANAAASSAATQTAALVPLQSNDTLVSLFAKQCDATPEALAAVQGDGDHAGEQTTYAALRTQSAQVAYALREALASSSASSTNAAASPIDQPLVGLLMERRAPILAALFGIMQAGAAYLPFDAQWPAERMTYIAGDATLAVILTDKVTWSKCGHLLLSDDDDNTKSTKLQPLFVDELLSTPTKPLLQEDFSHARKLAYVLYTSGTSGRPKGVCVEHHSVVNEVRFMGAQLLERDDTQRTLFASSVCFDASVDEIFVPLSFGGSLVVVNSMLSMCDGSGDDNSPMRSVTLLNGTPSSVQMLIDTKRVPTTTRVVLMGGEALPRKTANELFDILGEQARVYNVYGPTEATDLCLVDQIFPNDTGAPLLGRPIANTLAHVMTPFTFTQLPIGVPGELVIQGPGVARGYWQQDDLTKQRFLNNIDHKDEDLTYDKVLPVNRVYRTGDLVKRRSDGRLEYLGRIDRQIKLRGYRIELDEIEAQLCECDGVSQAVVIVSKLGNGEGAKKNETLVAYYVVDNKNDNNNNNNGARQDNDVVDDNNNNDNNNNDNNDNNDNDEHRFVRLHCEQTMPKYMVPSVFIKLEKMPLNSNDKLDYKSLPKPSVQAVKRAASQDGASSSSNSKSAASYRSMNGAQRAIADVWASALGCEAESLRSDSDFFEVGGDSLSAMRAMALLSERIGRDLPLSSLFQHTTLASLASFIGNASSVRALSGVARTPIVRVDKHAPSLAVSFAQERFWFLDQMFPGSSDYNMPARYDFYGNLDLNALKESFGVLLQRHVALRQKFVAVASLTALNDDAVGAADVRAVLLKADAALERAWHVVDVVDDVEAEAKSAAEVSFDLSAGPPVRVTVLRVSDDHHIVMLTLHHIAGDGASFNVLEREWTQLYEAAIARKQQQQQNSLETVLPVLSYEYIDYAHWQREAIAPLLARQLDYWRDALADNLSPIELPYDRPHPVTSAFTAASVDVLIKPALAERLRHLARSAGATMFMILLAAWQHLLHVYSRQECVTVGSPIAGRSRAEFGETVGVFVNTLVFRAQFTARGDDDADAPSTRTFMQLLARVKQTVLGAFDHQDVPFEQLVKELQPERDERRNPLFQVMFDVTNADTKSIRNANKRQPTEHNNDVDVDDDNDSNVEKRWQFGEARVESREPTTSGTQFELALSLSGARSDGALSGELEFAQELFDHDTVARMADHFVALLTLVSQPTTARATPLSSLVLRSERERRAELAAWSANTSDWPSDATIYSLFAEQVLKTPKAIAIVPNNPEQGSSTTFERLAGRSATIADAIVEHCGSYGDDERRQPMVGVLMRRGALLVATLLGAFRAGAAYVPLDAGWPAERLAYVTRDAGIDVLLTDRVTWRRLGKQILDAAATLAEQEESGSGATDVDAAGGDSSTTTKGDEHLVRNRAYIHFNAADVFNNDIEDEQSGGESSGDSDDVRLRRLFVQPLFVDELFASEKSRLFADVTQCFATPESLAYVLYTSGTTGKPKGVCVEHRSVVNEVYYMGTQVLRADELERTLFATSVCFDASIDELFVPLSFGGSIVVVESMLALAECDDDAPARQVSLLNGTPSSVQMLLDTQRVPPNTRIVLLGGEALSRRTANELFATLGDDLRVFNVYGPTEATDLCLIEQINPNDTETPLLGKPIANMRAHIVAANTLTPVPLGVAGELVVQGPGVARGYWRREKLTAKRFLAASSSMFGTDGGRAYRTGDLVRRKVDGKLEYLGRIDRQIKLRGYRIELDEIEAQLCACPALQRAVVVLHDGISAHATMPSSNVKSKTVAASTNGGGGGGGVGGGGAARQISLVGYYVGEVSESEAMEHCQRTMPRYMVPSALMRLDRLPLNRNDKVDYKALPPPLAPVSSALSSHQQGDASATNVGVGDDAPLSLIARQVADLWKRVLRVERVGLSSDFFASGGSSLSAVRLVSALKRIGLRCVVQDLFAHPTLRELSNELERRQQRQLNKRNTTDGSNSDDDDDGTTNENVKSLVRLASAGKAKADQLFLVHPAGGSVFCFFEFARRLASTRDVDVYAFQYTGKQFQSLTLMASAYADELQASVLSAADPNSIGNVYVGGYSFGATVACEVARIVAAAEAVRVDGLLLLDSAPNVAHADRWDDQTDLIRQGIIEFYEYYMGGEAEGEVALEQLENDGIDDANLQLTTIRDKLQRSELQTKLMSLVATYVDCARLMSQYEPPKQRYAAAHVTLVCAKEDPDPLLKVGLDNVFESVETVDCDGSHLSMLDDEHNARQLASLVAQTIFRTNKSAN